MKKLVIFGTGDNAELSKHYFELDFNYKVVAFTVDSKFNTMPTFCQLPVVDFEEINTKYPPSEYELFIAVGYSKMNSIREEKYKVAKSLGYKLPNYISPRASVLTNHIGDNNLILEDNTIQPFVKIGSNNVIWSGNHIGHHGEIKNHCFISSQVTISGRVLVNDNCFIGVNSTLRDNISIAYKTLIGAHSWISKSTKEYEVYSPLPTKLFPKKSIDLEL